MKKQIIVTKEQRIKDLSEQAKKLQAQLTKMNKTPNTVLPIQVSLLKTDAHFYTLQGKVQSDDVGIGKYNLYIDIVAGMDALYIPISIASGRKSAGFIYQIEGTAGGTSTATIKYKGDGITTVTSGAILYCKIPSGTTATFRIFAQVTGARRKAYKIVVSRINYKLNPNDLRYKRFLTEISTDVLKFR